jgi:hypothetical protein
MKVAVEHIFNGQTANLGVTYDSSKTMLSSLMKQFTGTGPSANYVTIAPSGMVNIPEVANTTYSLPHVIQYSENIFWIFAAQNTGAAQTRTIGLFEFNSNTSTITWKGFVTMNSSIAGNKTVRALRAFLYTHSDGTVQVSGTGVTGTSTSFSTSRIAAANSGVGGARIGFGSTAASGITTWYEISSIASDTNLTLKTSVPAAITGGTPYIIEEIRLAVACTNATTTNAGIHLIKGLNYGTFDAAGTSISDAVSTDNLCATYTLRDTTSPIGIQTIIGLASDDMAGVTLHDIYLLNMGSPDASTQVRAYKFNLRAALTVSSGVSTSAFVHRTNVQTVTGTISQINNGRLFTLNHGVASGSKSVWFVTTTRVYRIPVSNITNGATNFISDFMIEIAPGGNNITYNLTNAMAQVDYSSIIDRLYIPTSGARFGVYVGDYDTTNTIPFEKIFGAQLNRYKLASTPTDAQNGFFPQTTVTLWTEGGWLFAIPNSGTSGLNWLMAIPHSADGFYANTTNQRIITPKLATTNATKLYRAYIETNEYTGSYPLGFPTESYRAYYRTSGIDDNSGSWTEIPLSGDLTGVAAPSYIQFMFELDVLGESCVPARIYNIACVYEDGSQDSHYQPSLTKSSASSRIFAWKQVSSWGGTIPNLQIRLYNADTGYLVLDDNVTSSASGTFQYSTDGTTWNSWSSSADTVGNYIRYTANSLPSSITIRALLTQA